jgi:hypothetical protein
MEYLPYRDLFSPAFPNLFNFILGGDSWCISSEQSVSVNRQIGETAVSMAGQLQCNVEVLPTVLALILRSYLPSGLIQLLVNQYITLEPKCIQIAAVGFHLFLQ